MSTPESIVVSLEKARELKEAGWVGSEHLLWAYHCFDYPKDSKFQEPFLTCRELEDHYHQWEFYDAPTAEEILRRLPNHIEDTEEGYYMRYQYGRDDGSWWMGYSPQWSNQKLVIPQVDESSLANAAASMWIYLSKNNLLPKA